MIPKSVGSTLFIYILCIFLLKADLLDFYNLESLRILPVEIQANIASLYLEKYPYNVINLDIDTPLLEINLDMEKDIWVATFNEKNQIMTFQYDHNFVWELEDSKLTKFRVTKLKKCTPNDIPKDQMFLGISFIKARKLIDGLLHKSLKFRIFHSDFLSWGVTPHTQWFNANLKHTIISTLSVDNKICFLDDNGSVFSAALNYWTTTEISIEKIKHEFIATVFQNKPNVVIVWQKNGHAFKKVCKLKHPSIIYSAVFNDAQDRLVTSCKDGKIRIWQVRKYTIFDHLKARSITLEQLLLLKLFDDIYAANFHEIDINLLATSDLLKLNLRPGISSLDYLNNLLNSFGPKIKNYLIKKYKLKF